VFEVPCTTWADISGNAFDTLNRDVAHYAYQPFGALETWTTNYDQNGYVGLTTSKVNPMSVATTIAYFATTKVQSVTFSDSTPSETYSYDPDGRISSVTSATFGSDVYTYDAAGDEIGYREAAGAGTTSPEQLSYTYYQNGWRASTGIAASAIPSGEQFQFSYRNDGRRTALAVTGLSNPFSWTYSNAGRMLTQSDPYTGSPLAANAGVAALTLGPLTNTYDGNGQLLSETFPGQVELGVAAAPNGPMSHDAEGEITGYSIAQTQLLPSMGGGFANGTTLSYNVRGEFHEQSISSPSDGTATPESVDYVNDNGSGNATDPLTGAGMATEPSIQGCTSPRQSTTGLTNWDNNGRFISTSWNEGSCGSESEAYTFDDENHTLTDDFSRTDSAGTYTQNDAYAWGASGQMRTYTNGSAQYTLHWDGSSLLFVTDSSGNLAQFNIESLAAAQCTAGGSSSACIDNVLVTDRDFGGNLVDWHNGTGTNGTITAPNYYYENTTNLTISGQYVGDGTYVKAPSGNFILQPRVDGYQIGTLTFSGVRAFSPWLGTWTTPDPDAGTASNPLSQRSYTWLGNNPVTNADPTGYFCVSYELQNGYGQVAYSSDCPPEDTMVNQALPEQPQVGAGPGGEPVARMVARQQSEIAFWEGVGVGSLLAPAAVEAGALIASMSSASGITLATPTLTSVAVIGSYPAYTSLAEESGADAFSVSASEWSALGEMGMQWDANQFFLDAHAAAGDAFVLATPYEQVSTYSYQIELEYLMNTWGYTLDEENQILLAP
jgi:RHS repeat-associated protein